VLIDSVYDGRSRPAAGRAAAHQSAVTARLAAVNASRREVKRPVANNVAAKEARNELIARFRSKRPARRYATRRRRQLQSLLSPRLGGHAAAVRRRRRPPGAMPPTRPGE